MVQRCSGTPWGRDSTSLAPMAVRDHRGSNIPSIVSIIGSRDGRRTGRRVSVLYIWIKIQEPTGLRGAKVEGVLLLYLKTICVFPRKASSVHTCAPAPLPPWRQKDFLDCKKVDSSRGGSNSLCRNCVSAHLEHAWCGTEREHVHLSYSLVVSLCFGVWEKFNSFSKVHETREPKR